MTGKVKKFLKWYIIIGVIIVIVGAIGSAGKKKDQKPAAKTEAPVERKEEVKAVVSEKPVVNPVPGLDNVELQLIQMKNGFGQPLDGEYYAIVEYKKEKMKAITPENFQKFIDFCFAEGRKFKYLTIKYEDGTGMLINSEMDIDYGVIQEKDGGINEGNIYGIVRRDEKGWSYTTKDDYDKEVIAEKTQSIAEYRKENPTVAKKMEAIEKENPIIKIIDFRLTIFNNGTHNADVIVTDAWNKMTVDDRQKFVNDIGPQVKKALGRNDAYVRFIDDKADYTILAIPMENGKYNLP
jgi:hypothetical protein